MPKALFVSSQADAPLKNIFPLVALLVLDQVRLPPLPLEPTTKGANICVTNTGDVDNGTTVPLPVVVYSPTTPALSYNTLVDVPEVIVVVPIVIVLGPVAPVAPAEPVGPVAPFEPFDPAAPVGPVAPVGPTAPVVLTFISPVALS